MTAIHGRSRYTNDGCRCDLCLDAARSYNRAYRDRPGVREREAERARIARAEWRWPSYEKRLA
jgi:hypothetical protein